MIIIQIPTSIHQLNVTYGHVTVELRFAFVDTSIVRVKVRNAVYIPNLCCDEYALKNTFFLKTAISPEILVVGRDSFRKIAIHFHPVVLHASHRIHGTFNFGMFSNR